MHHKVDKGDVWHSETQSTMIRIETLKPPCAEASFATRVQLLMPLLAAFPLKENLRKYQTRLCYSSQHALYLHGRAAQIYSCHAARRARTHTLTHAWFIMPAYLPTDLRTQLHIHPPTHLHTYTHQPQPTVTVCQQQLCLHRLATRCPTAMPPAALPRPQPQGPYRQLAEHAKTHITAWHLRVYWVYRDGGRQGMGSSGNIRKVSRL